MEIILNSYHNHKDEIQFVSKLVLLYFVWKLFEYIIGSEQTPIDSRIFPTVSLYWEKANNMLRTFLLQSVSAYFNIISPQKHAILNHYSIWVAYFGEVRIGNYCLGVKLWFFYSALFVSYKSTIKLKILYIVIGILTINLLNIVRIILLLYTLKYWPNSLSFNHDYLFDGSIYLFSIVLFIHFVQKTENRFV